MAVQRIKGEWVMECNDCGSEEYAGTLEFQDFISECQIRGWVCRKSDSVWEHRCPECNNDEG